MYWKQLDEITNSQGDNRKLEAETYEKIAIEYCLLQHYEHSCEYFSKAIDTKLEMENGEITEDVLDSMYRSMIPLLEMSQNGQFVSVYEKRLMEIFSKRQKLDSCSTNISIPATTFTSDLKGQFQYMDSTNVYLDFAIRYCSINNFPASQTLFLKGIELRQKKYPNQPAAQLKSKKDYAEILMKIGKLDLAENILLECLVIHTSHAILANHESLADIYFELCKLCILRGHMDQAESYIHQCIDIRSERLGSDHILTQLARKKMKELKNAQEFLKHSSTSSRSLQKNKSDEVHGLKIINPMDGAVSLKNFYTKLIPPYTSMTDMISVFKQHDINLMDMETNQDAIANTITLSDSNLIKLSNDVIFLCYHSIWNANDEVNPIMDSFQNLNNALNYLERLCSLNPHTPETIKNLINFSIQRARGSVLFQINHYAISSDKGSQSYCIQAIQSLNTAITMCRRVESGVFAAGLSDTLILLTVNYGELLRWEDALHSARLAVNAAHQHLENYQKTQQIYGVSNLSSDLLQASLSKYEHTFTEIGPVLDPFSAVILSYSCLAYVLENIMKASPKSKASPGEKLMKSSPPMDWISRAIEAAKKFKSDRDVKDGLQKLIFAMKLDRVEEEKHSMQPLSSDELSHLQHDKTIDAINEGVDDNQVIGSSPTKHNSGSIGGTSKARPRSAMPVLSRSYANGINIPHFENTTTDSNSIEGDGLSSTNNIINKQKVALSPHMARSDGNMGLSIRSHSYSSENLLQLPNDSPLHYIERSSLDRTVVSSIENYATNNDDSSHHNYFNDDQRYFGHAGSYTPTSNTISQSELRIRPKSAVSKLGTIYTSPNVRHKPIQDDQSKQNDHGISNENIMGTMYKMGEASPPSSHFPMSIRYPLHERPETKSMSRKPSQSVQFATIQNNEEGRNKVHDYDNDDEMNTKMHMTISPSIHSIILLPSQKKLTKPNHEKMKVELNNHRASFNKLFPLGLKEMSKDTMVKKSSITKIALVPPTTATTTPVTHNKPLKVTAIPMNKIHDDVDNVRKESENKVVRKNQSPLKPTIPEEKKIPPKLDEENIDMINRTSKKYFPYLKGTRIEAKYLHSQLGSKSQWYPGRIVQANFVKGLYEIEYDNGVREKDVWVDHIRVLLNKKIKQKLMNTMRPSSPTNTTKTLLHSKSDGKDMLKTMQNEATSFPRFSSSFAPMYFTPKEEQKASPKKIPSNVSEPVEKKETIENPTELTNGMDIRKKNEAEMISSMEKLMEDLERVDRMNRSSIQNDLATKIQSMVRGNIGRKLVRDVKKENPLDKRELDLQRKADELELIVKDLQEKSKLLDEKLEKIQKMQQTQHMEDEVLKEKLRESEKKALKDQELKLKHELTDDLTSIHSEDDDSATSPSHLAASSVQPGRIRPTRNRSDQSKPPLESIELNELKLKSVALQNQIAHHDAIWEETALFLTNIRNELAEMKMQQSQLQEISLVHQDLISSQNLVLSSELDKNRKEVKEMIHEALEEIKLVETSNNSANTTFNRMLNPVDLKDEDHQILEKTLDKIEPTIPKQVHSLDLNIQELETEAEALDCAIKQVLTLEDEVQLPNAEGFDVDNVDVEAKSVVEELNDDVNETPDDAEFSTVDVRTMDLRNDTAIFNIDIPIQEAIFRIGTLSQQNSFSIQPTDNANELVGALGDDEIKYIEILSEELQKVNLVSTQVGQQSLFLNQEKLEEFGFDENQNEAIPIEFTAAAAEVESALNEIRPLNNLTKDESPTGQFSANEIADDDVDDPMFFGSALEESISHYEVPDSDGLIVVDATALEPVIVAQESVLEVSPNPQYHHEIKLNTEEIEVQSIDEEDNGKLHEVVNQVSQPNINEAKEGETSERAFDNEPEGRFSNQDQFKAEILEIISVDATNNIEVIIDFFDASITSDEPISTAQDAIGVIKEPFHEKYSNENIISIEPHDFKDEKMQESNPITDADEVEDLPINVEPINDFALYDSSELNKTVDDLLPTSSFSDGSQSHVMLPKIGDKELCPVLVSEPVILSDANEEPIDKNLNEEGTGMVEISSNTNDGLELPEEVVSIDASNDFAVEILFCDASMFSEVVEETQDESQQLQIVSILDPTHLGDHGITNNSDTEKMTAEAKVVDEPIEAPINDRDNLEEDREIIDVILNDPMPGIKAGLGQMMFEGSNKVIEIAVIQRVFSSTEAALSGIEVGDGILQVNQVKIKNFNEFLSEISQSARPMHLRIVKKVVPSIESCMSIHDDSGNQDDFLLKVCQDVNAEDGSSTENFKENSVIEFEYIEVEETSDGDEEGIKDDIDTHNLLNHSDLNGKESQSDVPLDESMQSMRSLLLPIAPIESTPLAYIAPLNMIRSQFDVTFTEPVSGMKLQKLSTDMSKSMPSTFSHAPIVFQVTADSQAHLGGVMTDDIVIATNGNPVTSFETFIRELSGSSRPLTLRFYRPSTEFGLPELTPASPEEMIVDSECVQDEKIMDVEVAHENSFELLAWSEKLPSVLLRSDTEMIIVNRNHFREVESQAGMDNTETGMDNTETDQVQEVKSMDQIEENDIQHMDNNLEPIVDTIAFSEFEKMSDIGTPQLHRYRPHSAPRTRNHRSSSYSRPSSASSLNRPYKSSNKFLHRTDSKSDSASWISDGYEGDELTAIDFEGHVDDSKYPYNKLTIEDINTGLSEELVVIFSARSLNSLNSIHSRNSSSVNDHHYGYYSASSRGSLHSVRRSFLSASQSYSNSISRANTASSYLEYPHVVPDAASQRNKSYIPFKNEINRRISQDQPIGMLMNNDTIHHEESKANQLTTITEQTISQPIVMEELLEDAMIEVELPTIFKIDNYLVVSKHESELIHPVNQQVEIINQEFLPPNVDEKWQRKWLRLFSYLWDFHVQWALQKVVINMAIIELIEEIILEINQAYRKWIGEKKISIYDSVEVFSKPWQLEICDLLDSGRNMYVEHLNKIQFIHTEFEGMYHSMTDVKGPVKKIDESIVHLVKNLHELVTLEVGIPLGMMMDQSQVAPKALTIPRDNISQEVLKSELNQISNEYWKSIQDKLFSLVRMETPQLDFMQFKSKLKAALDLNIIQLQDQYDWNTFEIKHQKCYKSIGWDGMNSVLYEAEGIMYNDHDAMDVVTGGMGGIASDPSKLLQIIHDYGFSIPS